MGSHGKETRRNEGEKKKRKLQDIYKLMGERGCPFERRGESSIVRSQGGSRIKTAVQGTSGARTNRMGGDKRLCSSLEKEV